MADGAVWKMNSVRMVFLLAAVSVALSLSAFAQRAAPTTADAGPKTPAFEVVSVKPSKGMNSFWKPMIDGFSADTSLRGLIMTAYGIRMLDQISGLPEWANSSQFQVDAKMGADQLAQLQKLPREEEWKQRELMLQSLLADRFNLKVHHTTKEGPIYALVIAKGGIKMKESSAATTTSYGLGLFTAQATPIGSLVMGLSNMVGRLIVDKTGLTGKYDINLRWTPDDLQGPTKQSPSGPIPHEDSAPSIFTALQEQLGLKLESQKAPLETIVIDHVEKPSEN